MMPSLPPRPGSRAARRTIFSLLVAAVGSTLLGALVANSSAMGSAAGSTKAPTKACLAPASWAVFAERQPQAASKQKILAELSGRDVLLLGEEHDNADHHQWQLQVLSGLHALRPEMVIGFEMFPRRVQAILDRWVAGELSVKEFLAQAEWEKVWNTRPELYLPLFEFARLNRIPMLALNIDQELTRKIADRGWDALPLAEREGVGQAAAPSDAYRDFLFEVYRQHATMRGKSTKARRGDAAFARFVDSQLAWDRAMAEVLAGQAAPTASGGKPLLVGIMGSGHLRFGHGVPHQLRDLGVRSIGTLLPLAAASPCDELVPGLADAVFAVPTPPRTAPEPPRLGVTLESKDGRVLIASVSKGSLAEKSGLQDGDRILAVAGQPLNGLTSLLNSIRQQPPGTWLPLHIERAGEKLEIIVRFPAQQ
ncbi:ChaN family lipoprotein [Accumulibacter sp.]|uniref:ChaN family lipoprotein n=1 Tax=Accumulibacter sp. TaxID=2053492 RepID=UPI0035B3D518